MCPNPFVLSLSKGECGEITMLKVENLHAGYGGAEVLNGVNLEVKQGTLVALIGANGAGKTTTMRAISGMIRPSVGKVTLEGTEVEGRGL
jgi:branched-chain amino acid transport system ATP-binding protein